LFKYFIKNVISVNKYFSLINNSCASFRFSFTSLLLSVESLSVSADSLLCSAYSLGLSADSLLRSAKFLSLSAGSLLFSIESLGLSVTSLLLSAYSLVIVVVFLYQIHSENLSFASIVIFNCPMVNNSKCLYWILIDIKKEEMFQKIALHYQANETKRIFRQQR